MTILEIPLAGSTNALKRKYLRQPMHFSQADQFLTAFSNLIYHNFCVVLTKAIKLYFEESAC